MEHGLLAIALYKLANICKLLSSCGFFRLESFQLTHYIRVCKFDSKQLTLYCKLLKFWNLRSMHASYPLLWIDFFFKLPVFYHKKFFFLMSSMALVSSSNYFYRILNTFIWKIAVLTVWGFFCLSSPNSTPQNKHEMAVTVVGLTPRPGCRQWVGILVTLRSCLPTAR